MPLKACLNPLLILILESFLFSVTKLLILFIKWQKFTCLFFLHISIRVIQVFRYFKTALSFVLFYQSTFTHNLFTSLWCGSQTCAKPGLQEGLLWPSLYKFLEVSSKRRKIIHFFWRRDTVGVWDAVVLWITQKFFLCFSWKYQSLNSNNKMRLKICCFPRWKLAVGIHISYILHKELRKRLSACTLSGPEIQEYVPYPLGTAKDAVLPKRRQLSSCCL